MKIYISVIKFLLIGALFIISNENLALSQPESFTIFTDHFASWLGNLFNQGTQITSYVVNSEWLPQENVTPIP